MVKYVVICFLLALQGCASIHKTSGTAPVIQKVPVVYCPAPEPFQRPVLPLQDENIDTATPGEVAKKYKATITMLLGYIKELELQLNEYGKIDKEYEALSNKPQGHKP